MIGVFASLAAKLGVAKRLQRVAGWAMMVVAAIAAIALVWAVHGRWVASRERAAVQADRAAAESEMKGRTLDADRAAGAAKDVRDDAFANSQDHLREKADAPIADGNRTALDAVFDGLR